jgi:hypothetical protein
MRSRACVLAAFVGLALVPGCGGPALAPVKGRVTCNGKPVAEAAVTFAPVAASDQDKEPGRAATGFTDADGYYVLSTHKAHDGALVGKHRVTVQLDDTNPARCGKLKRLELDVANTANVLDIELDATGR